MDDIQSWWEVPSIAHFCSLFRVAFNLLDFDIEELEEALLTDGAEDCGSSLLQELIVRLLCGCLGNNGISTFNYQMFLRRLFRQKCREYGRENPFNTDMDFQFLPLRTKVEILYALCDFRLDADDVMDVLKNLDSDSLRVHPLGYDENRSAYWYFYGTRLYREDYPKAKRKKKKLREREKRHGRKRRNSSSEGESELEMGCGEWQVVCYTESDWERLALQMEDSQCKEERALHAVLAEDFLPEIPRLFEQKERLQRKRLLEMQPRRQSSRLEKLKHQKEEAKRLALEQEQAKKLMEEQEQAKREDTTLSKEEKEKRDKQAREHRALLRSRSRSNSTCGSSVGGASSTAENNAQPRGRQTNNSLSSATGQIIIQPSRQKLRTSQVFRQSEEDLQTGLYKILERLKNHDDAWPFVDPVEEEYAPRYYSVISKPMDLQKMEDKLDGGEYLTFNDFKADFQLIVDNCRQYNGSDNEYTEMVGKLQESFNAAVERYLETEMSTDEEVAVEFPGEQKGRRKKSAFLVKETADSLNRNDTDDENGGRDESDEEGSQKDVESQTSEKQRRGKKCNSTRPMKKMSTIKNVTDIEALELATEQTLKDINKWLDDTPRFSEFSSASNSPSQLPCAEDCDGIGAKIENEYRAKLERPVRHREKIDVKRRLLKDPCLLKRRKEVQRTIDRLQPGKSKGNLLSNLTGALKISEESPSTGNFAGIKAKDLKNGASEKPEEAIPKLSLGTVLTNDVIGFGQHSFGGTDDDSRREQGITEALSEEKPLILEENHDVLSKVFSEHTEKHDEANSPPAKRIKTDEKPQTEGIDKCATESGSTKQEKSTPNLSAWFKAFGLPKSQPVIKKKVENNEDIKNSPKPLIESNKSAIKDEDLNSIIIDEDREKKSNILPAMQSPVRRQRKASTGSSVSERSSFSQDPTDPLLDGSSPRPSLDEPYLSPQSDPLKTPYHHSPINGTIRVGFYQDTSFARGSSDKSSSPREPPNCSPREPLSCSPREPVGCSPRDVPNCSPREPMASPKMDYPLYSGTTMASYRSPTVTNSTIYESPLSPYPAHMTYFDTSKSLTDQYRSQAPPGEKPLSSVFPVKKRICSEVDPSVPVVKTSPEIINCYRGGSFTPTRGAMEQERGFTPTPGRLPTQPVSRLSDTTRHTFTSDTQLPMGLTHHGLPHHLVDPYSDERILSSSYFSSEGIYGKNVSSNSPHTMFSETNSTVSTTASYARDQPSAISYATRQEVNEAVSYDHVSSPSLTYSERRTVKVSDGTSPDYPPSPSISLAVRTKPPTPVLNYSNRNSDVLSPRAVGSASPINYSSNSELLTAKVSVPSPISYLNRSQEIISNKSSSSSPLGYNKLPTSDLLSSKMSAPSPISYASNRTIPEIIPPKSKSPYNRPVPELPTSGISYNHSSSDLVTNKINVPSPLSYSGQADMLSGKINYSHPIPDIMSNPSRYNYPITELIPGKAGVGYNHPITDLMQNKASTGSYSNRSVELLAPSLGGYNRPISELLPAREISYPAVSRPISVSKPSDSVSAKPVVKKIAKKKKNGDPSTTVSSSFQQYLGQTSTEAVALKTTSVVPGSAFNFGPAPLKDSYASYLEDMRSSGYYVPHPEPSAGSKSSSPGPHGSTSSFSYLGHPSSRPPTYPHPFINAPYQQYLQRHSEELLRPMVLHQSLLPPTGYAPGYLGMHDAISRPSWL